MNYYALVDYELENPKDKGIWEKIAVYLEKIHQQEPKFEWSRISKISTTWEVICNVDDKALAKNHIIFKLHKVEKLFKIDVKYAIQLCTDPVIKS